MGSRPPYVTVKCGLRRADESAKLPGFEIGMLPLWNTDSKIPFLKANTDDNSEVSGNRGEWVTVSHGNGLFA